MPVSLMTSIPYVRWDPENSSRAPLRSERREGTARFCRGESASMTEKKVPEPLSVAAAQKWVARLSPIGARARERRHLAASPFNRGPKHHRPPGTRQLPQGPPPTPCDNMAAQRPPPPLQWLCGLLLLACAASALKFDLAAHSGAESQRRERCIRNFVPRETLVVVTVTSDGTRGDGMMVNVHVGGARGGLVDGSPPADRASDPRCPGQRVRPAEGRGRRVALRLHLARRRPLRRLL